MMDCSHRDRVNQAIRFHKPDRTPRDFAAVPEIWDKLGDHFSTRDRDEILKQLGVDCRIVSYDSFCRHPNIASEQVDLEASRERSSTGGMWRAVEPDGSNRDIWGAHRRRIPNEFGCLDQLVSYPLEHARNLDDLRRYRWPEPEWWDFSNLRAVIGRLNQGAAYNIRYRVGSVFETGWSLYGLERFLLKLASEPEEPRYVMERIAEVHLENLRRVLEIAGDLVDIVYFHDDLASQDGLLVSPNLYGCYIRPFHKRLIETARKFGKPAMLHSCGSIYALIPRLIDMGLAILNPVQPSARNMAPEKLAREFGGRIAFHGGVDVQQFLPRATAGEVGDTVVRIAETLGALGGYIRAGSHHLQADTPLENILEMYSVD
jgi:uroporphyrinogen decarboxylase